MADIIALTTVALMGAVFTAYALIAAYSYLIYSELSCSYCFRTFPSEEALEDHKRTHESKRDNVVRLQEKVKSGKEEQRQAA